MQILENITYLWLIAGAILVICEFLLISGVGFLFAGLGALTVGLLLEIGMAPSLLAQWIIFFAATALWTLLLLKPLARFRLSQGQHEFSDMLGKKAILLSTLEPGKTGQARWSGTIMNAKLDSHHKTSLSEGTEVMITKVEGNTLIVK